MFGSCTHWCRAARLPVVYKYRLIILKLKEEKKKAPSVFIRNILFYCFELFISELEAIDDERRGRRVSRETDAPWKLESTGTTS